MLCVCVSIAYDSTQERTNISHNIAAHDTFHNTDATHQSKPSFFDCVLDDS